MALADFQISYGGVTLGPGTSYRILKMDGFRGQAPLQTNDTPLLTADGVFSGYDTQLARIMEATVMVQGTSAADLETQLSNLEAAMAPLLSTTSSLHWKFPSAVERKIEARPRKCTPSILPTIKKFWLQVDLMWSAPAPAIINA